VNYRERFGTTEELPIFMDHIKSNGGHTNFKVSAEFHGKRVHSAAALCIKYFRKDVQRRMIKSLVRTNILNQCKCYGSVTRRQKRRRVSDHEDHSQVIVDITSKDNSVAHDPTQSEPGPSQKMQGPSQETYESSQESFGLSQGTSSEPGLREEILSEAADVPQSLAQQIYDPEKASQDVSEDSDEGAAAFREKALSSSQEASDSDHQNGSWVVAHKGKVIPCWFPGQIKEKVSKGYLVQFLDFGDHLCTAKNVMPMTEYLAKKDKTSSALFKVPANLNAKFDAAMKTYANYV